MAFKLKAAVLHEHVRRCQTISYKVVVMQVLSIGAHLQEKKTIKSVTLTKRMHLACWQIVGEIAAYNASVATEKPHCRCPLSTKFVMTSFQNKNIIQKASQPFVNKCTHIFIFNKGRKTVIRHPSQKGDFKIHVFKILIKLQFDSLY